MAEKKGNRSSAIIKDDTTPEATEVTTKGKGGRKKGGDSINQQKAMKDRVGESHYTLFYEAGNAALATTNYMEPSDYVAAAGDEFKIGEVQMTKEQIDGKLKAQIRASLGYPSRLQKLIEGSSTGKLFKDDKSFPVNQEEYKKKAGQLLDAVIKFQGSPTKESAKSFIKTFYETTNVDRAGSGGGGGGAKRIMSTDTTKLEGLKSLFK